MFLSLSGPSYMTSLFLLWNILLWHWKKTCKCICYWPQFRFVGIQQAGCCRTIPAVKSLSVKAVFHFSIHFSIHISKHGSWVLELYESVTTVLYLAPESEGQFWTGLFALDKLYPRLGLRGKVLFLSIMLAQPAKLKQVLVSDHWVDLCTELGV